MVLSGVFNDIPTRILKDDGCTSSVISREFAEVHRNKFAFCPILMDLCHSKQGSRGIATKMTASGTLGIGNQSYTADWIVADARYDVLLGISWNVDCNQKADYQARTVIVDGFEVSAQPVLRRNTRHVQSMGVKQFLRVLRSPGSGTQVFRVRPVSSLDLRDAVLAKPDPKPEFLDDDDAELRAILCVYEEVFQVELSHFLPPSRDVNHHIELLPGATPPHRPPYQLSPAELLAAREFVDKLLQSGRIRLSRSLYGAPLFFVKEPGPELPGVLDYKALNRITKRDDASLPRCDEIFDRLGQSRYLSKLERKTAFIRSVSVPPI